MGPSNGYGPAMKIFTKITKSTFDIWEAKVTTQFYM